MIYIEPHCPHPVHHTISNRLGNPFLSSHDEALTYLLKPLSMVNRINLGTRGFKLYRAKERAWGGVTRGRTSSTMIHSNRNRVSLEFILAGVKTAQFILK
jgi:hypothetical protein